MREIAAREGRMKILYVEDNEDNVYMLKNRLSRAGFTVIIATDGAQGVAMATSEQPDLILMDLTLPDMDGWEATQHRTYKNHLDGYNQMDLLTGKGDNFKFTFYAQPWGWPGEKITTDMPSMVNIRQDPFERTPYIRGESSNTGAFGYGNDFFAREFWRFVLVQQFVEKLALTAVDYPPMQDPASFNLDTVKKKVEEMIKNRPGQ
jgi:Response regulator receiver domain